MAGSTILQEIVAHKHEEVARRRRQRSIPDLEAGFPPAAALRGFAHALRSAITRRQPGVIAEIKKASPSKGLIRADFDAGFLAANYAEHGATCLSVLTDEKYFQGHDEYLRQAREACKLPVLRKDFMVDPYQIFESRWLGADSILLIVAALAATQLRELHDCARSLGLDVLLEVHDRAELETALQLDATMVGINNRDLHSFRTDLQTTFSLLPLVPDGTVVITESGINTRADVLAMQQQGVYGYLIGESFMRAENPGRRLREVVFGEK